MSTHADGAARTVRAVVHADARDGVCTISIDNAARRNAMTLAMWRQLRDCLDQASADASVRILVVQGAGGEDFCAGADVSEFDEMRSTAAGIAVYGKAIAEALAALETFPKPTIALVKGVCIGGALGLALSCDLRFADASARFQVPAAKIGLGYGPGSIALVTRKLGPSHAADILFSARIVEAEEALRLSLVNRSWPVASFGAEAAALIRELTQNAPLTLSAIKAVMIELGKPDASRDMTQALRAIETCFESEDYVEGKRTFGTDRVPRFTGR